MGQKPHIKERYEVVESFLEMDNTISKQIRSFIVENFLFSDSDNGPNDTDSFLDSGMVDSTGVLELVAFLEETYDIQVEDEELIPENLDSIANATAYIEKKRSTL